MLFLIAPLLGAVPTAVEAAVASGTMRLWTRRARPGLSVRGWRQDGQRRNRDRLS